MRLTELERYFLDWFKDVDEHTINEWNSFKSYWLDTARKYNYYHMLVTEVTYGNHSDESEYVVFIPKGVFTEMDSLLSFLLNEMERQQELEIRTDELLMKNGRGYTRVFGIPLNTINTNRGYNIIKEEKC